MNQRNENSIDRIVDQIVDDKDKARELKKQLHNNLGNDTGKFQSQRSSHVDGDEMWDNMPV